mgnify:CR=1 FL=1
MKDKTNKMLIYPTFANNRKHMIDPSSFIASKEGIYNIRITKDSPKEPLHILKT